MDIMRFLNKEIHFGKYYPLGYPVLMAILGPLLLLMPFIGILLVGIPTMPHIVLMDYFVPGDFAQTGKHVDIGFAWIGFKTTYAWIFYVVAYFLYGLYMVTFKFLYEKKFDSQIGFIKTYFLSAVTLIIILFSTMYLFGFLVMIIQRL